MKKKLLYLCVTISIFVVSVFASVYFKAVNYRYHQHLEEQKTEQCNHINNQSFCTHLPIISINTGDKKIPGEAILDTEGSVIGYTTSENNESMIPVSISIINNENNNHLTDKPSLEKTAMFRIRGNSSRLFDKKSYQVEFIKDDGTDDDVSVMGMSKHSDWALNGPFLDKTLIRNYLCMNISAEIMGYVPNIRFCEVYLDNEYQGLYVMMETISVSEDRVNITKYKEGKRGYGYIVKIDKEAMYMSDAVLNQFSNYTFITENNNSLSIEYPPKGKLNNDINTFIEKDISKFEKSLYSFDFNHRQIGYSSYIDVDSFVDYYILMEFLCVNDMMSMSTYLYKDVNGKLTMGPLWDFNNAMDNFINISFDGKGMYFTDRVWYKMLLKDERFVQKVISRFHSLRKTFLSEEYLLNYIDETVEYLGESIDRNYNVWGYSFDYNNLNSYQRLRPYDRNPKSYDESIVQMKEFIKH